MPTDSTNQYTTDSSNTDILNPIPSNDLEEKPGLTTVADTSSTTNTTKSDTSSTTPTFAAPQTDELPKSNSGSNKKTIATILGVVLLVAGVAAGVLLVNQNTELKTKAWDCTNYIFEVSVDGIVTVRNGSTRNEPDQAASVNIDGQLVATLDVPALDAGEAATLGRVPVPSSGNFTWEVNGSKDCEDSGSYGTPPPQASASCSGVTAYDLDGNELTRTDLSNLSAGDVVRFIILGTTVSGEFDAGKFEINGTQYEGTKSDIAAQSGISRFYYDYTIPSGVKDFTIKGEVHHTTLGWL